MAAVLVNVMQPVLLQIYQTVILSVVFAHVKKMLKEKDVEC